MLFSIALIKFIHSFDVYIDIEQSKPLVRTFYAEKRCALLISGISKTLKKELLKTCFISVSCKKKTFVYVNCYSPATLYYYINYGY